MSAMMEGVHIGWNLLAEKKLSDSILLQRFQGFRPLEKRKGGFL
jgi:hypothetical protein